MFFRSLLALGGASLVFGKVQLLGMNIPGGEFGCLIDGTCPLDTVNLPLTSLGGGDGAGQMSHFVTDDQMNIFRIPISWQYLTKNVIGKLDADNFGNYDQVMQACIKTGAYCVIDIHNFARFNGGIIGQGGPTDAQFVDLWTQLATAYANDTRVVFGLMNEPHDIDIKLWANTVQTVVTAIRKIAPTQMILLPGNNFTSAGAVVSSGSGAALIGITNPDKSTDGLILEVHKYLDSDNSGTHDTCVTDNVADAFTPLAAFLRTNKRMAIVSETGAGHNTVCTTDFCAQNTFINQNSDVFLGLIAWGAGSFTSDYILSLVPTEVKGKYVDDALASQCVIAPWQAVTSGTVAAAPVTVPTAISSTSGSSTKSVSGSTTKTGSSTATTTATANASKTPVTIGVQTQTGGSASPSSTKTSGAVATGIGSGLLAAGQLLAFVVL